MDRILQLSARLTELIEFRDTALLGGGRGHNPLFDPDARATKPRRIGEGVEQTIPISRVISPQATVETRKVRSLAEKHLRGTLAPRKHLPEVLRQGENYVVHDGNHYISAMRRAGQKSVRVLVQ